MNRSGHLICNYQPRAEEIGISHRPKRKPNGITKADREAKKTMTCSNGTFGLACH